MNRTTLAPPAARLAACAARLATRAARLAACAALITFFPACSKTKAAEEKPAAKAPAAAKPAKAPTDHPEHSDEPEHEELPKRVKLTPRAVADAKIETAPAARKVLANVLELPGEIAADPDRIAKIASPVAGRLEQVSFREGSTVQKGEVLAAVRVPDFARAKADLAGSVARAQAAKLNADRLTELASKGLAADQEVRSARAEADALDAQAKAAGELVRAMGSPGDAVSSRIVLRAPIAGVVTRRDAVVGQPVSTEATIATIANLSEAWFLGRVFEKDLGRLRVGSATEVRLNAFPDQPFAGKLEYIGREIDPVARTLTARVRLTNEEDRLRIGLFGVAKVEITSGTPRTAALVVPRTAVIDAFDKKIVFVREADGDFELHEVVLGEGALGEVEVVSGLRENEPVVVRGAFTLKSAVLRGTLAEAE
ncbi:efflux RND transporter periplasmic adaptor subunit [Pendulispora albinea]|uniref:Efflux RND transporter periplasmic adaptor subunit n=1 Tax=Pendulispora albinea TaxID=2741071 RepID=A0ABZ2M909_9BACT